MPEWKRCSPEPRIFFGVERLSSRLAYKNDKEQGHEQGREWEQHQPPLRQVLHPLINQFSPARSRRWKAEAEKVERDQRADVTHNVEWSERDYRSKRVRENVLEHDAGLGGAHRDGGADVVL